MLRAYLQSVAQGELPKITALLGHPITLRHLELQRAPAPGPEPGMGDLLLRLWAPDGGAVDVLVTGPLIRGLVGLLLDEDPGPPAPLSAAEAGLMAGLAHQALEELGLAQVEIRDVAVLHGGEPQELPPEALRCVFTWHCGPAVGELELRCGAAVAASLESTAEQWRPAPGDPGAHATLVAELVLACTSAANTPLDRLQLGDAVVFPTPAPGDDDWPVQLRVAGRRFAGILRRTPQGRAVELQTDAPDSADGTLTAVLGRVALTATAVAGLAPGVTIALDQPVGETIHLHAAGRLVGSGELLEVDGSLAVRLTEQCG